MCLNHKHFLPKANNRQHNFHHNRSDLHYNKVNLLDRLHYVKQHFYYIIKVNYN